MGVGRLRCRGSGRREPRVHGARQPAGPSGTPGHVRARRVGGGDSARVSTAAASRGSWSGSGRGSNGPRPGWRRGAGCWKLRLRGSRRASPCAHRSRPGWWNTSGRRGSTARGPRNRAKVGVPGGSRCTVRERPGRRLVVRGDVEDPAACQAALKRWLLRKARAVLVPRLLMLADERGFVVEGFSVRSQRGRWGSCSRRGAISLNMKLLFLPENLSDHVLLHELCHTRHMDHSPAFWALMREHDRDSESKNRLLRVASQHVPAWLEAGAAGSERWTPSL